MTFTAEVSWGELLELDTRRYMKGRGLTFKDLVAAANAVERGVQNTYAKLFDFDDEPARQDDRLRAYLLALLIGKRPGDYGIVIDRPAIWPSDNELRKLLNERLNDQGSSSSGCMWETAGQAA